MSPITIPVHMLSMIVATTRSHDAGPLLNWLLYPHRIGLHVAHHLYPTVSFVHLPRVQAALVRDAD